MTTPREDFSIVGTSVHRVDGIAKVTGKAKYTGDLVIPELIEGRFLRSPYAHARIGSIDTTEAESMPGVFAVVTRKDFTDIGPYIGRGKTKDQPIIALDRAIFAGQPVAAVAAVDRATAEEAMRKINVDYEELPAVIDVDDAMADGAPLVHSFAERNICFQTELVKGDVEKGFAEADEIFEDRFEFPMIYHYSMEPHTAIALVDGDGINIWTSTGHPFGVRQEIAEVFHYPLSKIRVHVNFVGGAYGGKSGAKIEPLVVALARKAGRPVRVVQNVSEAMATCRRHAIKCKVKTGVKKDGTLVAKQAEIYLNTGAYAETGPVVTGRTLTRILGPYRYPHLKVNSFCIYTNTVSAASFRSIGGPQTAWATESQIDIIAQKLGLDPVVLRLKNLVKKGEEIRPKYKPLDADLSKGLRLVVDKLGWDGAVSQDGRGRGVGFGTTDPGAPLASTATAHVLSDGSVVLLCGTVELGQGAKTVMSQIVAEELCVPLEQVTIRPIDTAFTPFDRSTGSSRSTTVMGKAVELAGTDARQQILELAAEYFEAPEDAITLKDGEALAGGRKVSYGELIHRHFAMQGGELVGRGYAHSGMAPDPANPLFWEIGIGAVEVEVDRETGKVNVKKYVTAADAGKALHPLQCEGQDEGSAMMGFGHTFYESYQFDGGQIINANLVDYKVPTFDDVPDEFESILIEDANGPGPYGAKGLGEGGIIPVAPAVANAVAWSTGARIKELPLTPEKVWRPSRRFPMRPNTKRLNPMAIAVSSLLLICLSFSSGFSQAPFYQGKTITIIRGSTPGGVGEMRTRAVANHLKNHIPGNPTIVIEFMPGAGGQKAANHLYSSARADGLVIGSAPSGMVSSAVLGAKGVQYDLDKFIYLGSPNSASHYVFFTNRKLGLGNLEKLRAYSGLRIGAQTVGHPIYYTGRLFALLLGLKDPKFVVGYSSPELDVALLSGELDAMQKVASSVVKQNPEFLEKGLVDFHAIIEIPKGDKHPRFAQLPELDSFVKSDKERNLLALHRSFRLAGSPFVLPPGTPKEPADILRVAMRRVYTDREFLVEYKKMTGEEASPLLPDAHEKAIRELPRDPEVIEFYKVLGGTQSLPPR